MNESKTEVCETELLEELAMSMGNAKTLAFYLEEAIGESGLYVNGGEYGKRALGLFFMLQEIIERMCSKLEDYGD